MTMLEQLSKLSSAEEFFHLLDVPYDQAILNVARLHILRRMGEYLKHAPATAVEESERAYFRAHLLRAYEDFAQSSPLDERVFKYSRMLFSSRVVRSSHWRFPAPSKEPLYKSASRVILE